MICGIDEAGRGPVIGPMVVAGIVVKEDTDLIELDVKDSKRLSPKRRKSLETEIKKLGVHSLRILPAEEIDRLRDEMSLNEIEAGLFASIIEEICDETTTIYVDAASTDEEKFAGMIQENLEAPMDIISRHGADDSYPVVSAASILAKVKRDQEVELIEEELGEEIGSGYPSDMRTRDFLVKWIDGHGDLPPYTRRSWETAREILSRSKNSSLDDF
ncbi:MAG: ribonuclease HII [Candidatus Saliniplasma sp.]